MALTDTGAFNYSRAVREWCFIQRRLVDLSRFRDAAKARGLSDLGVLSREPWETLDREDIFVPVAYALHGHWERDQDGCLEDGDLTIREEVGYRASSELLDVADDRHGGRANIQVLYHEWQLLWLAELQVQLTPPVPWGSLGGGVDSFFEAREKCGSASARGTEDQLRELAAAFRRTELLLVRVQNMLLPPNASDPRQGTWRGGRVRGLTDDVYEWTIRQFESTDFSKVATDCGVNADGLASLYGDLARKGLSIDPTEHLVPLLDQIRRSRREGLRGGARLALDYYDAARVIRSWHHRITEELLPDVDEFLGIDGTEYKRRRFGTLDVRGNRAVLPILLEDYGIYPWRVQLISEGDSEITALRSILQEAYGMSFDELGIAVTDMQGADIPENADRLLADLHIYANYFLLVFDNEGKARQLVEALQRAKVIEGPGEAQRKALLEQAAAAIKKLDEPDARTATLQEARGRVERLGESPGEAPEFNLWRENFEADNFTLPEMMAVVEEHARIECGLTGFTLDIEEVRAATEAEAKRGDRGRAVASVLLDAAKTKDAGFVLSKPNFARLLARYALEHPEFDGSPRKLLDLAEHLVRLTWSDRRLQGKVRR